MQVRVQVRLENGESNANFVEEDSSSSCPLFVLCRRNMEYEHVISVYLLMVKKRTSVSAFFFCALLLRSEDEMADEDISRIMIVTQTPPSFRRPAATDQSTSDLMERLTIDNAQVINDGLFYLEQVSAV